MRSLILASTSPYRRAQLEQLGLRFETEAPGVDEGSAQASGRAPEKVALELAEAKAAAVGRRRPEAVVIAGDQLVELDGAILGKPGTEDAAIAQLSALRGRTHALHTAVAVWADGRASNRHLETARLTLRRLDEAAIRRYVAFDRPLDCAGAYKFERSGIALFERVEVADPSAITGLPLMAVVRLLVAAGQPVP